MNKEQIYDEKVSPLMTEIIKICKENDITMLASFSIPTEEHEDLGCTTALLDNPDDPAHKKYVECVRHIRQGPVVAAITVTKAG